MEVEVSQGLWENSFSFFWVRSWKWPFLSLSGFIVWIQWALDLLWGCHFQPGKKPASLEAKEKGLQENRDGAIRLSQSSKTSYLWTSSYMSQLLSLVFKSLNWFFLLPAIYVSWRMWGSNDTTCDLLYTSFFSLILESSLMWSSHVRALCFEVLSILGLPPPSQVTLGRITYSPKPKFASMKSKGHKSSYLTGLLRGLMMKSSL